ncbi:hypothetical protein JTE90_029498 [Oedothorax gibbosus]|uniref:Uncharacterized protein n=1 Tax=Oedothorax gibbosus TaxID=931172 RepID=A0AAV6UHT3_9ARAC|nr:hypothetical protein JTE90_029498 [Oedothorax gibbosus]
MPKVSERRSHIHSVAGFKMSVDSKFQRRGRHPTSSNRSGVTASPTQELNNRKDAHIAAATPMASFSRQGTPITACFSQPKLASLPSGAANEDDLGFRIKSTNVLLFNVPFCFKSKNHGDRNTFLK